MDVKTRGEMRRQGDKETGAAYYAVSFRPAALTNAALFPEPVLR